MARQISEIPKQGQNPSSYNFLDRHFHYLVSLTLSTLGLLNDDCADDTVEIQRPKTAAKQQQQKSSVNHKQLLLGKNSASDNDSIWGCRFFSYGGDESSVLKTHYHNYQYNSDNEIYPGYLFEQDWNNAITEALGYSADYKCIQEILKGEQCQQKERLIYVLQGFVFILMINEPMSCMFTALVDACNGNNLDSLARTILSGGELFVNTAFCDQGVKSIVKLLPKLKKSGHAYAVNTILSTKLFEIMTDHSARRVIQQCFIVFGHEPNRILYERTIQHCYELATHKVGCTSLKECISTIAGEQRSRLFNCIADASYFLSFDPYGNYVVQSFLDLNNEKLTARILSALKGHHIKLAQHKEGSNVVEKCMVSSKSGLIAVVNEILVSPKTILLLAQDHFGNYVVQQALRELWKCKFWDLHKSLVGKLKRYHKELSRTTGGRKVIELMDEQQ